ncbi:hypothetical protein HanIR_Chr17g0898091 [Helianthus annuus]|nr:hypothetical protein HanIR_Chr17g0898091 [Helianthus annuus]
MNFMTKLASKLLFNFKTGTKLARSDTFRLNDKKSAAFHTTLAKQTAAPFTRITNARLRNPQFTSTTHGLTLSLTLTTLSHFDFTR